MRITVRHTLDDLHDDLVALPRRENTAMTQLVTSTANRGRTLAQGFAEETSGEVGRHFPKSITVDHHGGRFAFGGGAWSSEYGQDSALKQGNMDFENGGGKQTSPHLPHAKSVDIVGPQLGRGVRDVLDDLFWGA